MPRPGLTPWCLVASTTGGYPRCWTPAWRAATTAKPAAPTAASMCRPRAGPPSTARWRTFWYETLGNLAYFTPGTGFSPQAGYGLTHFGPFANLKSGGYWSDLEYLPVAGRAWAFGTVVGNQVSDLQDHVLYAMAVRSGDVAAALPEPHASVLALTALGALAFVRRRRPR